MPATTEAAPGRAARRILIRVSPEVRQAIKIASAQEGTSMEAFVHDALCRATGRRDLLARPPGRRKVPPAGG